MENKDSMKVTEIISSLLNGFSEFDWEKLMGIINQYPEFKEGAKLCTAEIKKWCENEINAAEKKYKDVMDIITNQIDVLNTELVKDSYTSEEKERIYSEIKDLIIMANEAVDKANSTRKGILGGVLVSGLLVIGAVATGVTGKK